MPVVRLAAVAAAPELRLAGSIVVVVVGLHVVVVVRPAGSGRLAAEALAPRPEQSARWPAQDKQQDWAPRPERAALHPPSQQAWPQLAVGSSRNGLRGRSRLLRLRAVAKACRRSLDLSRCLSQHPPGQAWRCRQRLLAQAFPQEQT